MGQLPGTSANKSDTVVTEEVSMQQTKELRSTVSEATRAEPVLAVPMQGLTTLGILMLTP